MVRAVLVLIFLTGCAPALTPAPRDSLAEAQRFLDEVSRAYGVQTMTMMLGTSGYGDAATMRVGGLLTLMPKYLDQPRVRDDILAHEMAHLILGHLDRPPDSRERREQREIDADVKAVEILQRVGGMTERDAFAQITWYALSLKQAYDQGRHITVSGHPHPCRKVEALIKTYPAQQGTLDRLQQQPGGGRCP